MGEEQVVQLKKLGLSFPIYTPDSFTDFGFVPSIAQQRRELDVRYNCITAVAPYVNILKLFGAHYKSEGPLGKHSYIYFADQNSSIRNLYTRGHEETHVAEFFGQLEQLAAVMEKEQGIRIEFDKIIDFDVRAEIGALFALENHGFNPDSLIGEGKLAHPFLRDALGLYEGSRVPKRTILIPSTTDLELKLSSP